MSSSHLHVRRKKHHHATSNVPPQPPPTILHDGAPKSTNHGRRTQGWIVALISVVVAWMLLSTRILLPPKEEEETPLATSDFALDTDTRDRGTSSPCQMKPTRFRTNNLVNPLALEDDQPVFSWALALRDDSSTSSTTSHYQSAYRIRCILQQSPSSQEEILWDSGKIQSQETLQIEFAGKPLQSLQRVQWQVQVWDQHDQECSTNNGQEPWPFFETGLLDEAAWQHAPWLARYPPHMAAKSTRANARLCDMMAETPENQAPRFRTTLQGIEEEYAEIRAYIVGLGYYQLYMNGQRVGDSLLDPGWTTYSKRVFYSAYNVTAHFRRQSSVVSIAVELGNGWWNPLPLNLWDNPKLNLRRNLVQGFDNTQPIFRLQLFGWTRDGRVKSLLDDDNNHIRPWRASGSPTTFNNIFLGEVYDARLEHLYDGWTTLQYHNHHVWERAVGLPAPPLLGKLQAQPIPPIRRQQTLQTALLSTSPGQNNTNVLLLDTGVNHAGSCRIQLLQGYQELAGQQIQLLYGELLHKNGTINGRTSVVGQLKKRSETKCQPDIAYQQDIITLGDKPLDWTPSWSWHGFRYIQVTLPAGIHYSKHFQVDCFTMRTDVDVIVSNFTSSDPWLDELRTLVRNTFESNLMSVESDCPHRERFQYGGDQLGAGEAGMSIYDWSSFLRKRVLDYNDAQRRDDNNKLAGFTETAPYVGIADKGLGFGTGPIGWQTFQPEALLWLYKYYGDIKTLRESFPHTKAYIDLLDNHQTDGIQNGLGDWMPVHVTDVNFTGLGFQRMSYLAFANITEILGMSPGIATRYRKKAANVADQINKRFLQKAGITFGRILSFLGFGGAGMTGVYRVETVGQGEAIKRTGKATQTGQAMALFNGFVESNQDLKRHVLLQLEKNVRESSYIEKACQCDNTSSFEPECSEARGGPGPHMTAGLFGVKWFLMALADGGLNDLAYDVVTTKSYPGLRWMTNNPFSNATTIWESFFFSDDTYSHNHPMFGSTEVWLLQSVVGIQPHPSARGMNHVLIRPNPPSQLKHASASFESPRGTIFVSWKRDTHESFQLEVSIPPNCHATVHVPASERATVTHNGREVAGRWVPTLASSDRGSFVVDRVGNGRHEFDSRIRESGTSSQ
ncbi:K05989 alpha-L-rhamnosidase [Seminavis robusta]|uniref:alpha-L-rhamnosidase n=1 Tax=Seminavis robusta TaxID=568900 RepID=A0A9N8EQ14_9STRA|nr:K05989 alpha-L-rhamnosidase [Seminavis robusta]|eukprot:Sro1322_g262600.1 K05989 alpha-L-rhamnosidase EC 3.2.1.40 (1125) ;mRNA; r:17467-20841